MLATGSFPDSLLPPHPQQKETSNNTIFEDSDTTPDNEVRRKRTYLALLPPDQIIDLCLTFERHVPSPIRDSLWPTDLDEAILKLKKNSSRTEPEPSATPSLFTPAPSLVTPAQPTQRPPSNTPLQQVHPPGATSSFELPVQPIDVSFTKSLVVAENSSANEASCSKTLGIAQVSSTSVAEPNLTSTSAITAITEPVADRPTAESDKEALVQPVVQSPAPDTSLSLQPNADHATAVSPTLAASDTSQPAATPHASYSYAPYGYPSFPPPTTPGTYPHTPYYSSSNSSVPSYPPYPGYPHYPPPPGFPSHTHQPPPPPSSSEDLPSYEDMIVEALTDVGEPEGAAPRDLFLWMGSRWPLQTNFRPSASQALQKAYKRGRLEKTDGGRYKLNPNWEGGATSKRTTRRPQTLAQTTYAMHHQPSQTPSTSPFTHTPLPHRSHTSPPPAHAPQHQPYPGYTYSYGYSGYTGYTPYGAHLPGSKTAASTSTPSAAAKPNIATKTVTKTAPSGKEKDSSASDEVSDAWEAAQHILKAINFGSLQGASSTGSASWNQASSNLAPPPIMDSLGIDISSSTEDDGLGRATLTDEERASLQAQLALLAAQLSEIASAEEEEEDEDMSDGDTDVQPGPLSRSQSQPKQLSEVSQTVVVTVADNGGPSASMIVDVNQFPDDGEGFPLITPEVPLAPSMDPESVTTAEASAVVSGSPEIAQQAEAAADEGESDDDEDMEMVDVDSYMRSEGIRT